jgi:amino acid transporter
MDRAHALKRSLRVMGALLLTLSSITPASSVFVIVPSVLTQAGTGAFWSMVLGALLCLPTAYVYAELASAFPIAGGEYSMAGRTIGPATGFVVLALNGFGSLLAAAAFSLGASTYLSAVIPGLNPTLVAIAIIVITTIMGVLHIRTNAWITGVFLLLELLALVVLAILGFWHVHRPLLELAAHPVWLNGGVLQAAPLALIGVATSAAIFAYNGYSSAIYFAEEMHDASVSVARTILLALIITIVTELIPVTAVLMGAPDLKALLGADNPFSAFILATGGAFLNATISICIAIAIFNAVLATVLQNARFFYSTGRDESWHPRINRGLVLTNAFHSPWMATLVAGGASVLLCFLGLNLVLVLTGTSIVFVYAAMCLSAIFGRRSGTTDNAAYRMPWYPAWPVIGLITLCYVVYTSALDPSVGQPSLLANGAIVIAALLYYWFTMRKTGWVLRGPAD